MTVRRKSLTVLLSLIAAIIGGAHLILIHFLLFQPSGLVLKLRRLFHLNYELGFGSYFSTGLLLFSSVILWQISSVVKKDVKLWRFLAIIFLFLSVDESLAFHEELVNPLRDYFGEMPLLYHAWTIAAIPVLVILGFFFLPFLLRLPRLIAVRFLLAAFLFVGGAVGIETLAGFYEFSTQTETDYVLDLMVFMEEILEMSGVILFIDTLIRYSTLEQLSLKIEISE